MLSCMDTHLDKHSALPFELNILIQGLESSDIEKVKKFLAGLSEERLKQLEHLNKEQVRLLMIHLMRLMTLVAGSPYRYDLVLVKLLETFPLYMAELKDLVTDLKSIVKRKLHE